MGSVCFSKSLRLCFASQQHRCPCVLTTSAADIHSCARGAPPRQPLSAGMRMSESCPAVSPSTHHWGAHSQLANPRGTQPWVGTRPKGCLAAHAPRYVAFLQPWQQRPEEAALPEALRGAVRCTAGRVPLPSACSPTCTQPPAAEGAHPPFSSSYPTPSPAPGSRPLEQHGPCVYMHTAADSCRQPRSWALHVQHLATAWPATGRPGLSSVTQGVHRNPVFWQDPAGARSAACLLLGLSAEPKQALRAAPHTPGKGELATQRHAHSLT